MPLQSLPFSISAIAYLALGIWVITRQKKTVQRLYGTLCVTTCLWQGIWAILFAGLPQSVAYAWLKICFTGIAFIPAVFYHFIIEFAGEEYERKILKGVYVACACFAASVWIGTLFLDGFNTYSWGIAAKAGPLHKLFGVLVALVIGRVILMFSKLDYQKQPSHLKSRHSQRFKHTALLF